jgi:hypothetical protein
MLPQTQTTSDFGELNQREVSICNLSMLVIMMDPSERERTQKPLLGFFILMTSEFQCPSYSLLAERVLFPNIWDDIYQAII